ncbi:MAG: HlyD family efflux transporter periplasmic adaptor subunit [Bacteroidaceae bacterium]|nr:HlyD family efflux transporter periplasmic adaptor subunit [Bacteroidaceae bacterium]
MDIQLTPRPWYVKYRYYLLAGTLFLAFAIYVIILALGPRQLQIEAEDYKIAEAEEAPFLEYVDVEGLVQPIQTIQVNALESGFVERIVAEEGAMLEVGDTILVLSNPDLLRTIDDEQADWANQQRNYREQEIEMQQRSITLRQQALDAEHQMASLDKSLKQSREEYRMGIKSKAELDVIEEDYAYQHRKAQLQMQSLHHDSVATQLKREMLQANREATNKKLCRSINRTEQLIVRATVAGQLSFVNVAIGQQVSAGSSIGEIKVLTEYKVHTSLSEYYIDRITTGLPAHINYQDKKYEMRISKVVPEVKDRNFACDLVFTGDKPSNIRLGKSYRVQIELGKPETALTIPRGDFYQATSGRWIYRLSPDGKTARKVDIEIGRQNPQQYEILSGLKPGDRVLISGYDKFGEIEELVIK